MTGSTRPLTPRSGAAPRPLLDDDPLLYKQVFDNAVVGICFMQDRRFVRVNRRMEEMLGYAPGELVGQSVRVVYAREQDYLEVGRVMTSVPRGNAYTHERPLLTKQGELRWCLIGGSWLDPSDRDSASVWIVQDISAKKDAEDQLARANQRLEHRVQSRTLNLQKTNEMLKLEVEKRRASERAMIESREKYRVLIRNVRLGIVITDAEGGVVEINPTMQAWLAAADLPDFVARAGRTACTIAGETAPTMLGDLLGNASRWAARRHGQATVSWTAPDGGTLWFDAIGVRVPVQGLGAALVFADRTEQHEARDRELAQQQQLAHAARLSLMGQFTSALAHELGQPLNACQSYAAGLSHRLAAVLRAQPDAKDALERIQTHLAQAGEVIRNVRTFIAQHRPEDEAIDVPALVRQTLELLQLQIRDAGVRVVLKLPADPPALRGTRVELQQVLVNLVLNAIEALQTVEGERRITITVSQPRARRLSVAVADNGPGVADELGEEIFEPYVTTKSEGLGMGLMMCRTIIESHGGDLKLETRRRRGATFRFTLPAGEAAA